MLSAYSLLIVPFLTAIFLPFKSAKPVIAESLATAQP